MLHNRKQRVQASINSCAKLFGWFVLNTAWKLDSSSSSKLKWGFCCAFLPQLWKNLSAPLFSQLSTCLGNYVFKLPFFPGIGGMIHHCNYCIVILLIFVIKEYEFCPEMSLFCSSEHLIKQEDSQFDSLTASLLHLQCSYFAAYLWNINSRPKELQVFPHFLRLEFRV